MRAPVGSLFFMGWIGKIMAVLFYFSSGFPVLYSLNVAFINHKLFDNSKDYVEKEYHHDFHTSPYPRAYGGLRLFNSYRRHCFHVSDS